MAKVYPSRRGRCLHRPGPLWVGPVGINVLPSHRTSGTMRASSPTRWENFAIHRASFFTFRGPLHTRRLRAAPSPSRRGRGIPCGGGGTRSVLRSAPHPSGLWPCHPLPGEGKGVLHLSQERVGVFSKFSERNPLLLGTLMLEYPRWLWPAQLLYPRLSCGRKPKAVFHQTPYLADGKFMKRWKTQ